MADFLEFLRGSVRPVLAYIAWGGTIALLILDIPVPDAWWGLVGAVTTFYFVYRHEEKKPPANLE